MSTVTTQGLCQCGCGQPTQIAKINRPDRGWVKGQPKRLVYRHFVKPSYTEKGVDYSEEERGFRTPCWIWKRFLKNGYAKSTRGRMHRVFYEEKFGPIPSGLEPDHLCKQKSCVNPDHIELVTHTENVRRGQHTKLTLGIARQIRALHKAGERSATLARMFGASSTTICYIVKGKQWGEAA